MHVYVYAHIHTLLLYIYMTGRAGAECWRGWGRQCSWGWCGWGRVLWGTGWLGSGAAGQAPDFLALPVQTYQY
jgi:hypothetical protein